MGGEEETVAVFISLAWFRDFHLQFAKHLTLPRNTPRSQRAATRVATQGQRSAARRPPALAAPAAASRGIRTPLVCFGFGSGFFVIPLHLSSTLICFPAPLYLCFDLSIQSPMAGKLQASFLPRSSRAFTTQTHLSCTLPLLFRWKIAFGLEKSFLNLEPGLSKLHFDEALRLLEN